MFPYSLVLLHILSASRGFSQNWFESFIRSRIVSDSLKVSDFTGFSGNLVRCFRIFSDYFLSDSVAFLHFFLELFRILSYSFRFSQIQVPSVFQGVMWIFSNSSGSSYIFSNSIKFSRMRLYIWNCCFHIFSYSSFFVRILSEALWFCRILLSLLKTLSDSLICCCNFLDSFRFYGILANYFRIFSDLLEFFRSFADSKVSFLILSGFSRAGSDSFVFFRILFVFFWILSDSPELFLNYFEFSRILLDFSQIVFRFFFL